MAEGILRHDGAGKFEGFSAGVASSKVRPEAIQAMKEIGIDISGQRSKSVEEFIGKPFEYVITVCDNAAILGTGGDEAIHGILDIMHAGLPYDVLEHAMHIHPTISELIPTILGEMHPAEGPQLVQQ